MNAKEKWTRHGRTVVVEFEKHGDVVVAEFRTARSIISQEKAEANAELLVLKYDIFLENEELKLQLAEALMTSKKLAEVLEKQSEGFLLKTAHEMMLPIH